MTDKNDILKEIEQDLTNELRSRQDLILEKIRVKLGYADYSFQRFNGLFGGKNTTFVDSDRIQFLDFNDFYSQWLKGAINQFKEWSKYSNQERHIVQLLKDKEIEEFVRIFLERNFYRKLRERTRSKPNEQLWNVWFGFKVVFGLLIAPVYDKGNWHVVPSYIRKASYNYWTIGHVLQEGFIDNNSSHPFCVNSLDEFESLFLSIFKQLSSSQYEKKFYERYIEYLRCSDDLENEPLLIPEMRYAGLEKEHKHRLDFTVLNSHTQEYTGFEISPSSSHMSIKGLKSKPKQKDVNNELSVKWDKEMTKRNEYFETFGITIITFTEKMLVDFDSCWASVERVLSARPRKKITVQEQLAKIKKL